VIQTHPDRESSGARLETVQAELASLKDREQALEDKLDMRKKQFHVLVSTIHQLQSLLDADETEDNDVSDMSGNADQDKEEDMEVIIEN